METKPMVERLAFRGSGGRVNGEPLLWISDDCGNVVARTLFRPRRMVRMNRANLAEAYHPGDFSIRDRCLTALQPEGLATFCFDTLYPLVPGCRSGRYLDGKRYMAYSGGHYFHDRQTCIDYETDEVWQGPVPPSQSQQLPRLMERLFQRQPVRIALIGDSISCGDNASAMTGAPPYQPPWYDLWVEHLQRESAADLLFRNFSKGGMTARWGMTQCDLVASFAPHLVVIAFGMNDLSEQHSLEEFQENIRAMIRQIRAASPSSECLLVAGMDPNPDWSLSFSETRAPAAERLQALAGEGVGFCDVRSVWNHVASRKGFWSLTGNGVNHPNDYGHRLYAWAVLASLGRLI